MSDTPPGPPPLPTPRDATDPAWHQSAERQIIAHIRTLLDDPRLRIDTIVGSRPANTFRQDTVESDHARDVKLQLSAAGRPDRSLEARFPIGATVVTQLLRRKWLVFVEAVARIYVRVISPVEALAAGAGEAGRPVSSADVQKLLTEAMAVAGSGNGGAPLTIVLCSTSGFTTEARELADRRKDRSVILVEPNDAGGWRTTGPKESRAVWELFDPEVEAEKRRRVLAAIEAAAHELTGSGIAADRLAGRTQLPPAVVEAAVRSYAKEHPGLVAKRLDGRLVLFAEGAIAGATAAPVAAAAAGGLGAVGGSEDEMPMLDRIKQLFGRKGETERKIAYLSERRALLGQQRDRAYEALSGMEAREADLKTEYATASERGAAGAMAKRRLTGQLLQLRKDVALRQQLLGVLNQQITVVGTHLHHLELVRTGAGQGLPDSEEMARDAARAEEVLAELQAGSELAESMSAVGAGVSDEESALMAELDAELAPPAPPAAAKAPVGRVTSTVRADPAEPSSMKIPRADPSTPEPG